MVQDGAELCAERTKVHWRGDEFCFSGGESTLIWGDRGARMGVMLGSFSQNARSLTARDGAEWCTRCTTVHWRGDDSEIPTAGEGEGRGRGGFIFQITTSY